MEGRPSRRDVLKAGAGAAAGGCAGVERAVAGAGAGARGHAGDVRHLSDIKNIVIFIQENRSFDHYFGRYKGARGFDDRTVRLSPTDDGTAVFRQSYPPNAIPGVPDPLLPFHIDTTEPSTSQGECTNDIGHQWADQHAMWNDGKMDNWVTPPPSERPGRKRQVRRHHHGLLPGLAGARSLRRRRPLLGAGRQLHPLRQLLLLGHRRHRHQPPVLDDRHGRPRLLGRRWPVPRHQDRHHPVARRRPRHGAQVAAVPASCSPRRASRGRCTAPPTRTSATTCCATSRSIGRSAATPPWRPTPSAPMRSPRTSRRTRSPAACRRSRGCWEAWSTASTRRRRSSGARTTPRKW